MPVNTAGQFCSCFVIIFSDCIIRKSTWQHNRLGERPEMQQTETSEHRKLDLAESLLHARRYDTAEAICHQLLQENSCCLEANFLLGTSAYHQNNWDEAVVHYRRAVAGAPDIGFLHANLALS